MHVTSPHVTIESLSKVFGSARGDIVALTDVTMEVGRGEFVSLLGPSGCGKSTLLKIVAGLEDRTAGDVRISGAPLNGCPDGLGFVFQRDVLLDWRTILDNVLLPAEFKNLKRSHFEARARELLALFGLRNFETRYPWELSGGMRQRVAICRALLIDPELLLMDEPFGALDALTRDELNIELQRMWMTSGKTVLFVTHSISEAILLSDRILVMANRPGRVVDVLEIDFPRPRDLTLREQPEFAAHTRRIRETFERHGMLSTGH
jgi:NitT/TauT family transport system ATP-binding protein